MKVFFLFASLLITSGVVASGRLVQPPIFMVYKSFKHYIKAEVIGKNVEVDSSGSNKVYLVLLVKKSFISKVSDTIRLAPIEYNNDEINPDQLKNIFMDIDLDSTYYFGLGDNFSLSPYISYNKISISNNHLEYYCYSKMDSFLRRNIIFYKGRKMKTEVFEKKLGRRND